MKKGLAKDIFSNVISFTSGVIAKKNPVVGVAIGAVKGIKDQLGVHFDKNIDSATGEEGHIDWSGIIGSVIGGIVVIVGLYLLATGKISIDDFLDIYKKTQ